LTAARAANALLRFVLELCALAGLAIWGWTTGPTGVNVILAIAAPVAAATLWGSFVAPRAKRHPPDPWRLLLEVTVFGAGTLALAVADFGTASVVLGVASAIHLALTFALDQRSP
jgi:Protein of unknown function (DUF2568)